MKTSRQIEGEKVTIAVQVTAEEYFRLKFEAEEAGYGDMSKYLRDKLFNKIQEANK